MFHSYPSLAGKEQRKKNKEMCVHFGFVPIFILSPIFVPDIRLQNHILI